MVNTNIDINSLKSLHEPTLFQGLPLDWSAFKTWDFELFRKQYSQMKILQIDQTCPELRDDFSKPPGFPHEKPNALFLHIEAKAFGGESSADARGTCSWIALIRGQRRFIFSNHSVQSSRTEMLLRPGEVLFVPCGWKYEFENLDDTLALSANFYLTRIPSGGAMPDVDLLEEEQSFRHAVVSKRLYASGFDTVNRTTAAEFYLAFDNKIQSELKNGLLKKSQLSAGEGVVYVNNITDHPWIEPLVSSQNSTISHDLGDLSTFQVGCYDPKAAQRKLEDALKILDLIWPEAAAAYRKLVTHVLWVNSRDFWSSACARANGLIFINPREEWTTAHFVETVVHETAHVELMIRQLLDPMLYNLNDVDVSPLRPDPRPLQGILHAAFVLSRTCEGLYRITQNLDIDEATRIAGSTLLAEFHTHRLDALRTLEKKASFTPSGRELFHEMQQLAASSKWP